MRARAFALVSPADLVARSSAFRSGVVDRCEIAISPRREFPPRARLREKIGRKRSEARAGVRRSRRSRESRSHARRSQLRARRREGDFAHGRDYASRPEGSRESCAFTWDWSDRPVQFGNHNVREAARRARDYGRFNLSGIQSVRAGVYVFLFTLCIFVVPPFVPVGAHFCGDVPISRSLDVKSAIHPLRRESPLCADGYSILKLDAADSP